MRGQSLGGGNSGAIVRSVFAVRGSGRSAADATNAVETAVATGAVIVAVQEVIEPQEPGAHGSRQESLARQSPGTPESDASCSVVHALAARTPSLMLVRAACGCKRGRVT